MSLKTRITFWTGFIVALFLGAFGFIQGMPEIVQADPTTMPPTIDQHLANINTNMQFIKLTAWGITGLLGLLGGALIYIFKSTVLTIHKRMDSHAEDIAQNENELRDIKKDFMSVETHKMICHSHRDGP